MITGVIAGRRDALCDLIIGIEDPMLQVGSWPTASAPAGSFRALAIADLDVIRYEPGAQDRGATRAC